MMTIDTQLVLQSGGIVLQPLSEQDFEVLYAVAADPEVWAQHPNKDRWQKAAFAIFFEGALQSKGAYKIIDADSGAVMGSTRFYDFDKEQKSIFIGYTFYAVQYWGKGINHIVKALMLDYAFRFVETVFFHIGAHNVRSQIAIGRIGARKTGEETVAYFGEPDRLNFVYTITRNDWQALQNSK